MFKLDNDTVALFVVGIFGILAILYGQAEIGAACVGAVGGYIGGKKINN